MPKEFSIKPRSLNDIHFWKATEFQQFVLYVGPIVLKDAVPNSIYNHFIKLSYSISILLLNDENKRNHYLDYAQKLIVKLLINVQIYMVIYSLHIIRIRLFI